MRINLDFRQKKEVRKGDILLAEPFLQDPNFERSVVLICEHDTDSSFGLVINKPSLITVDDLPEKIMDTSSPLYVGGPVQQDTLHYIHTFSTVEAAVPLKNGVFWGGDYENIKELGAQGLLNDSNCRFFMGYSGWGNHQLKDELNENSWVLSSVDIKSIFELHPDEIWKKILKKMGGKFKVLANCPTDPRLN